MREFNLGESEHHFRVPDGGLLHPGAAGVWLSTAALVVEILSPRGRGLAHVTWLGPRDGGYREVERSGLIALGAAALAEEIDWP